MAHKTANKTAIQTAIQTAQPRGTPRLPAYALYGEAGQPQPEHLHCESIAQRSQLHGWEIKPHRHEALFQLLVIATGECRAWLDGQQHTLRGPALVTVPALSAHGFTFSPDVQGHVFTVAEPHLAALLAPHVGLADAVMRPQCAGLAAPAAAAVLDAAVALRDDTVVHADWRGAALDAALLRLAVAVARARRQAAAASDGAAPGNSPAPPPRALAHVQRLRSIVDAQYRQQPSQTALAAQLGITPTQLNRVCQQVLGHSAQAVLHARLLLQAQRELAYTNLAVKQIALELGFVDAAYFTRFFRRLAGSGPAAWRTVQRAVA